MPEPILVAKADSELCLLPAMANRHGLIAGATGTGKTVTLQTLAEGFSRMGTPVFLADVKGDLAGMSQAGGDSPKIIERVRELSIGGFKGEAMPVTFWDVFGETGHPVRTTISEMGPLLLARLLGLNETQAGVLNLVFKIADDGGLLLLDLKDLRAMLQHVGENAARFTNEYGNVSPASIGAIQRNLLALEQQGGDKFFGEPALNLDDLLQTDAEGRGVINILSAERLLLAPKVYATLLLWLMSELFEHLPEAGDLPQPKLVFFFDEAHLLFKDISSALEEKVEQVVRLIRSKGVGVYFVTQNPADIPESVLGQLGNRVQHALRAFTPADEKAVRAAARTFRRNPKFDTEVVLPQLAVGEALVSLLDPNGRPAVVQRGKVSPPRSRVGAISTPERGGILQASPVAGIYDETVDRESAYERLKGAAAAPANPTGAPQGAPPESGGIGGLLGEMLGTPPPAKRGGGRQTDSMVEALAKSAARSIGSQVGRQIVRGLMGSIFGGTSRRRRF